MGVGGMVRLKRRERVLGTPSELSSIVSVRPFAIVFRFRGDNLAGRASPLPDIDDRRRRILHVAGRNVGNEFREFVHITRALS